LQDLTLMLPDPNASTIQQETMKEIKKLKLAA
jgi:hypothetical protein